MSYQDSLRAWVIYQLLSNCQRLIVERFRRRSEAENYLRVLQRLQPQAKYTIVFEMEPEIEQTSNLPQTDLQCLNHERLTETEMNLL